MRVFMYYGFPGQGVSSSDARTGAISLRPLSLDRHPLDWRAAARLSPPPPSPADPAPLTRFNLFLSHRSGPAGNWQLLFFLPPRFPAPRASLSVTAFYRRVVH